MIQAKEKSGQDTPQAGIGMVGHSIRKWESMVIGRQWHWSLGMKNTQNAETATC